MYKSIAILKFIFLFPSTMLYSQREGENYIERKYCRTDSSEQYCLYLPIDYTDTNKYSFVLFLDPGARATLPVGKYLNIANELNIILASSYNSRNFELSNSIKSIAAIYDDVIGEFKINIDQVFLAGFSGGARTASYFASKFDEIKGVIQCGAGLSGNETEFSEKSAPCASIVGEMDMNYQEILQLSQDLTEKNVPNLQLYFDGGHDWPPVHYMSAAINWLLHQGSPGLLLKEIGNLYNRILLKKKEGDLYSAFLETQQLKRICTENPIDSLLREMEKEKNYTSDKRLFAAALAEEKNYLSDFEHCFVTYINTPINKSDSHCNWNQKLNGIKMLANSTQRYYRLAGIRSLDFSLRLCVESFNQFMHSKEYDKAYKAAYILTFFQQPLSPNGYYLMAQSAAASGNKKFSLRNLVKAINQMSVKKETLIVNKYLLLIFSAKELSDLYDKETK